MRDGIALDEGPAPRKDLLQDLANNGAKAYTSTTVDETVDSVLALVRWGQDVR